MPRRITIPSCPTGRSGRCSRPSARAGALCRPVRRLPRDAGVGVEDLPGALRQQQVLGPAQRSRPAGRDPGLCRPRRDPPGRRDRRRACPPRSVATRRSTIPGITCRCWPASRGRSERRAVQGLGAAGRPGAGAAQAAGADDGDRQMVEILTAVLTDGLAAVEAACGEASPTASSPPTSSSTSWPGSATPVRRRRS